MIGLSESHKGFFHHQRSPFPVEISHKVSSSSSPGAIIQSLPNGRLTPTVKEHCTAESGIKVSWENINKNPEIICLLPSSSSYPSIRRSCLTTTVNRVKERLKAFEVFAK